VKWLSLSKEFIDQGYREMNYNMPYHQAIRNASMDTNVNAEGTITYSDGLPLSNVAYIDALITFNLLVTIS
jgi:hypothetical protein